MSLKKNSSTDKIHEEILMDLTPMIDVTFLLLIFFMLTIKFKILEGKLQSLLPLDKGLASTPAKIETEDVEIVMKVTEETKNRPSSQRQVRYFRNASNTPFGVSKPAWDDETKGFVSEPADTMLKIKAHLVDVRKSSPDSKAKINAWPEVPTDRVVNVLNMMIEAGYTDISYSGIPNNLIADLNQGKISAAAKN